jgi:hypothetical protein
MTLQMTPVQLRDRAYAALLRELGAVDFARFIQQFERGQGDYTRDRGQWLEGLALDQIMRIIEQERQQAR